MNDEAQLIVFANGWQAVKEKDNWRLEQILDGKWLRGTWSDSKILDMFFEDMKSNASLSGGRRPSA